ncbi:ATP-dependent zinc protease family protein [Dyadobacter frigoris]|uniref:ATP-dependent zinc protease n=1 Tax=Dyadobacter frigoris TaxID=2576211 RepID=A0A4U6CXK0_9BACT|nr:RimK/LysX family protein [Dyadobacter frigoris]TKT89539.1 ATP-dependent zinc protease [Dyadobacter frigoris]GLU54252.1 ribosomal protein S6 modification protein [Dyadobacter frigoris]
MKKKIELIGATDIVDLPELGWYHVPVRVDSGATTSAIHCARVKLIKEGEHERLCFYLDVKKGAPEQSYTVSDFKETVVRNSSGKEEKRYVIKTQITIFGRKIRTEFSLANRKKMSYPILLGRKLLKGRFLIDVSKKDLSAKQNADKIRHKKNPDSEANPTRLIH